MVNVKIDMTGWVMSEHGVPDSRLTVLKQAEDFIQPNGKHRAMWECKCSCGNPIHIITRVCGNVNALVVIQFILLQEAMGLSLGM